MNKNLLIIETIGDVTMTFHPEGLVHIVFKNETILNLKLINKLKVIIYKHTGNKPFITIYHFKDFSSIDQDILKWATDSNNNKKSKADVIVYSKLHQKMVIDFYTNLLNPITPTKIFKTIEEAKDWGFSELSKIS